MSAAIECPTCGAGVDNPPVDPRATLSCRYCGNAFERQSAEEALAAMRREVAGWLQRATGVAAGSGAGAVDAATRSFLFNDRILPGLRRDVRRALDEEIGDVEGSPLLVPALLRCLAGFGPDEATLLGRRDAVLGLRALRSRLESPDVAAFATAPADQLALAALRADIDRTMLQSNVAAALAQGLADGATVARANLEQLAAEPADGEAPLSLQVPDASTLQRATRLRAEALLHLLRVFDASPPDPAALEEVAKRLEEVSNWLMTSDHGLRTALASTGVQRDATAVRALQALAAPLATTPTTVVAALDALAPLAPLLADVAHHRDALALVSSWASALVARARNAALPGSSDASWLHQNLEYARQSHEQLLPYEVALAPFWLAHARYSRAEGFIFTSGTQDEAMIAIPAFASPDTIASWQPPNPAVPFLLQVSAARGPATQPIVAATVGPEGARKAVKKMSQAKDMHNVLLGNLAFVYLPVALARFASAQGERAAVVGITGLVPIDPTALVRRVQALEAAVVALRSS